MDTYAPYNKLRYSLIAVVFSAFCGCSPAPDPNDQKIHVDNGAVYLGQGWSMVERQQLSHTSFGSRLVDYDWFLALEQADSTDLFRADKNLYRLGFINETPNPFNPDGLPVGMSRDKDGKRSWIGLTCAACHTGELEFKGQRLRIDGGQSLINYTKFEDELFLAMKAALEQPDKWQRFIARLPKGTVDAEVRQAMQKRVAELDIRYKINATEVPYGHGRLDAFGQIFNAVAAEALQIPENARTPDAPTSFPVLWDASHLDVVQWNASAPNKEPGPLAQNATTALAVYGTVKVVGHGQTYPSSIQIQNLGYIQKVFYQLTAPKWPAKILGEINEEKRAQGEKIYQKECLQCHSLVDENDPKRKLVAVVIPAKEVGTDSRMVENFSAGKVKTGELEGKHFALWFGDKFGAEATRLDVVMHVTAGALARHPWDSLRAIINEYASNDERKLDENVLYYKARPINGIWASAPYLHNGSVPTVYDLLLPVSLRPTSFYVGNREIDPVKLGNVSTQVEGASVFDTSLVGNSNSGHEYGTRLSESERKALLEYIKTL
jgi:hypothetical protein